MLKYGLIFLGIFAIGTIHQAVAAPQECFRGGAPITTPTDRFVINLREGTIIDKKSGLMWKRCVEGKSGLECNMGMAEFMWWDEAEIHGKHSGYAGYGNWRLPTVGELQDIVERSCSSPAVNLVVFPGDPGKEVWTSSEVPRRGPKKPWHWFIRFQEGFMLPGDPNRKNAVRLVRDASHD